MHAFDCNLAYACTNYERHKNLAQRLQTNNLRILKVRMLGCFFITQYNYNDCLRHRAMQARHGPGVH